MKELRAWAEEQEPGVIYLTWEWPSEHSDRDAAADRRTVASALAVRQRITSAKPTDDGVLVRYKEGEIDKSEIAEILRLALGIEGDLKSRGNEMVRRIPTYLNLAQKLARDERISPLPGAAREMSYRRGTPAASMPLQMVPGFRLISRIHTILPVLQSLASWSRTAPPEVVEHHLASAGLTREQLDLDHATAHEMMLFARDYSSEKAGDIGRKAGEFTAQATTIGRDLLRRAQERRKPTDSDSA